MQQKSTLQPSHVLPSPTSSVSTLPWCWHAKRVLLTGAGGFIGSHLAEYLIRAGAHVKALVHYNSRNDWGLLECLSEDMKACLDVLPGDLTDITFIRQAVKDCQLVFHLGALIAIPYSYRSPRHFLDTNVMGTLNVMQACHDERVSKVIHTSTSETYGSARYTPMDEAHPLQGQSPYAASKIAADKVAESFYCSFELPVATIRPFNAFGPRQSARAVIPTIISQALAGETIRLGALHPVRDFTFVEDTVNAFIKVAESAQSIGEVFNVGTGHGVSIGDVTETILKLCGGRKNIVVDPERYRPTHSEVTALICDNTKAKTVLGWEPQYTLAQGLQRTIEYMAPHRHRYKTGIFNI
jgi:NAD dependent epimerase/dehydratase